MSSTTSLQWDLTTIFSGGDATSGQFQEHVNKLEKSINDLSSDVNDGVLTSMSFSDYFLTFQRLTAEVQEASAFISCLLSDDTRDQEAKKWKMVTVQLGSRLKAMEADFEHFLASLEDEEWRDLVQKPELDGLTFPMEERRERAKGKMDKQLEQLAESLSKDGYHGWNDMYSTLIGHIRVTVDGETLSVGQANTKLGSSDREEREKWSQALRKEWEKYEDVFAETLNHLGGFRLSLYEGRGWSDPLHEPLLINRMSEETLDSMWSAIEDVKPALVKFLERKKQMLGIEEMKMHDVSAPMGTTVSSETPFSTAIDQIERHFRKLSPIMADFARESAEKRWIEAEDRDFKGAGGFCTSFPISNQSRVFMTYNGTPSSVQTLAHELGHAYHQRAMGDMPYFSTRYSMSVAETASTLAEQLVADAAVQEAASEEERIALLDTKINRSAAFFMNIHARFLFEKRFYERRKTEWLSAGALKELMVEAQKEAYHDQLSEYDPYFWASKMHFFITRVPFYNFPYTFGYLFSLGILEHAKSAGSEFESAYIDLLKDTASMSVEDLSRKHLSKDLTDKQFWLDAAQPIVEDIEQFLKLTEA